MKSLIVIASLLLTSILVSGCASQSKLAKSQPDEWTELKCSGFLTWNECRQQARAICPNGYYVSDYFENYTIQRREVSVACKA